MRPPRRFAASDARAISRTRLAAAVSLTVLASATGCSPDAADGGAPGTGGTAGGGAAGTGGTAGSGGAAGTGGTAGGGAAGTGGTAGGGAAGTAGTAGGAAGTGGAAGGAAGTGGTAGGGGAAGTGGSAGTGGRAGAGGSGGTAGTGGRGGAGGAADPLFNIFLLLGQSNMEGAPQPQAQDRAQDARIKVLAYNNCSALGRQYNQWYTASPPLHSCGGGVGPGDNFAKTLIERSPAGATIGLVPCAVNGAPIDLFRKGVARTSHNLPPDNHWATGYEWIISRAKEAQKAGVIRGILFHQGESDNGSAEWATKVAGLVADLRADLGIGEGAPFIAGELLYTGCCVNTNARINMFPAQIPNAKVVSASGLGGTDQYHFDLAGQRQLGMRYGQAMIAALGL
jgi:hypothetical protein